MRDGDDGMVCFSRKERGSGGVWCQVAWAVVCGVTWLGRWCVVS